MILLLLRAILFGLVWSLVWQMVGVRPFSLLWFVMLLPAFAVFTFIEGFCQGFYEIANEDRG